MSERDRRYRERDSRDRRRAQTYYVPKDNVGRFIATFIAILGLAALVLAGSFFFFPPKR